MTYEYCCKCDCKTGRAGAAEDSLYTEHDGPFCENCFLKQEAQPAPVQPVATLFGSLPVYDTTPPAQPAPVQPAETSAERTLQHLGYTDNGGEFWKPPLGKPAPALQAELEATNRQVEILSDALAESRREVAALKAVQEPVLKPLSKKWKWVLHESFADVAGFDEEGIPSFYWKESVTKFKSGELSVPCKGKNCGSMNGWLHSAECRAEHEAQYATPPAQPAPVEPVACVACEGNPKWGNIPCAVCGTTPPAAQRQWVGLTDAEIDELSRTMVKGNKSVNWLSFSIEARLKENNDV